ncbi:hypothetical protein EJ04DRAFT_130301 [Polyplosphaeria fusca]|uniref:Uncharacterized protein n=1 Tax=Polyplosphaeria fusca TaxID=682080 RepID=A0A9P4R566_9PLEO|nr:hypothetical protein EJ04DRAFT_130301 [Polyplosphaeria fusca]
MRGGDGSSHESGQRAAAAAAAAAATAGALAPRAFVRRAAGGGGGGPARRATGGGRAGWLAGKRRERRRPRVLCACGSWRRETDVGAALNGRGSGRGGVDGAGWPPSAQEKCVRTRAAGQGRTRQKRRQTR